MSRMRAALTQPISPSQHKVIRLHLALIPVYAWALFVWSAYAVDISPPGRLDRSGHIKGHDFVHDYVLGQIALARSPGELYDFEAQAARTDRIVPDYEDRYIPVHGPQLSVLFAPFALLPYLQAMALWLVLSAGCYLLCCYLCWKRCPVLRQYRWASLVLVLGYPALYLLIAFGATSVLALLSVTAAYLSLKSGHRWLAGFALGMLFYKPHLGVILPFVFVYGREWRMVAGAATAVLLQLTAAGAYYGTEALRTYFTVASGLGKVAVDLEPFPLQMQSLRSFFSVLVPGPEWALGFYVVTATAFVAIAAVTWKSSAPLELRFAILLFCLLLVDPHVNAYDLIVTAPAFILTSGWALERGERRPLFWALLYLSFYLPAMTFVVAITHVQVSVLAVAILVCVLATSARVPNPGASVDTPRREKFA
ncbi:MAG TPA: glycosyltransferase family 87 protein [Vicinamibacterales bacterium]|nr:glycosyltransferase family 87 protein [Vicinamibacterales bacterium]